MIKKPPHPGSVFRENVMKPLNLSVSETARMFGVSRKTLSDFVHEKTALSPRLALRIGRATETSPEHWMNLQAKLTLWHASRREPKDVTVFPKKPLK